MAAKVFYGRMVSGVAIVSTGPGSVLPLCASILESS